MSYEFVFVVRKNAGTSFDEALELACGTGYRFFLFNGIVYFLDNGKAYNTGIEAEDLY